MVVCNICLRPPTHNGRPNVKPNGKDITVNLFTTGRAYQDAQIDLCDECLGLFQNQAWDKIAAKAHDVLLLRLAGSLPED